MKIVKLFDFEIFADEKAVLLEEVERLLLIKKVKKKAVFKIFTPNPEQVVQAKKDAEFKKNLKKADILLPDGAALVVASKILKSRGKLNESIEERITGVELVEFILSKICENDGLKALIVGGRDYECPTDRDSVVEVKANLFWAEAYESKEKASVEEEDALEKVIKDLKPDVIFVALGAPYQERWIIEHQDLMEEVGVKLSVAVGGSFDFILGKVDRAPEWMQKLNLEWFFRLVQEPWRWKRQTRLVEFLSMLWQEI